MKLTKPQLNLLLELSSGPGTASESYPPAKKLIEAGLVKRLHGSYGSTLHITAAGDALLAALSEEKGND